MNCETCSSPALYLCKCSNSKLCDQCFDSHCQSSNAEHQLLLIDEAEPTYTASELFACPKLVADRIETELGRLEGFRRNVLQAIEISGEEFRGKIRGKAREWKEKSKPKLDEQVGMLEAACAVLKDRPMIEELPREGFPWRKVIEEIPETVIELPGDMGDIDFSLDELIQVTIEWDLQGYPLDAEPKEKRRNQARPGPIFPQFPPSADQSFTDSQPREDSNVMETSPADPVTRLSSMLSNQKMIEKYLKERFDDGQLWFGHDVYASFDELLERVTLEVSSLRTTQDFFTLALFVAYCTDLAALSIKVRSSVLSDFSLLCQGIAKSRIKQLTFSGSKLTTAHISVLVSNLPVSVQSLDLSRNYFDLKPGDLTDAVGLRVLIVREVPTRERWIEEMMRINPQIEVVLSDVIVMEETTDDKKDS